MGESDARNQAFWEQYQAELSEDWSMDLPDFTVSGLSPVRWRQGADPPEAMKGHIAWQGGSRKEPKR